MNWMNLKSSCLGKFEGVIDSMREGVMKFWQNNNVSATAGSENLFKWVPRNHNGRADELSKMAVTFGNRIVVSTPIHKSSRLFRVHFDGSFQEKDGRKVGAGYTIEQSMNGDGENPIWRPAMEVAFRINSRRYGKSAILSEIGACWESFKAVWMAVEMGHIELTPHCRVRAMGTLRDHLATNTTAEDY